MLPAEASGPRYLDPLIVARAQDTTIKKYRAALARFLSFLRRNNYRPQRSHEFDDLLVEWHHAEPGVRKGHFEAAIASLEFVLPAFKGRLPWSRAVAASWSVSADANHKVPMGEGPAVFIGVNMAAARHPRLGAGVVLQQALGLHPSEILGVRARDVTLPEHHGGLLGEAGGRSAAEAPDLFNDFAVLVLGIRAGTKAKRPQTVLLKSPRKIALLRWLLQGLEPDDLLIGYTYEQYRRISQKTCTDLQLDHTGWSPHSPRAGFASDMVAAGEGFQKTRELGRWVSESSFRTYVDVTAASAIMVTFRLRSLTEAMAYACAHLLTFFEGSSEHLRAPASAAAHASSGLQAPQVAGRLLGAGRSAVDSGPTYIGVSECDDDFTAFDKRTHVGHASSPGSAGGAGNSFEVPSAGHSGRAARCPVVASRSRGGARHSGMAARGRGRAA